MAGDGRNAGEVRGDDDVVKILKGNMDWHCDSTYLPVMAKGAVDHTIQAASGLMRTRCLKKVVKLENGLTCEARSTRLINRWCSVKIRSSNCRPIIRCITALQEVQSAEALRHQHSKDSEYSGYGFEVEEVPLKIVHSLSITRRQVGRFFHRKSSQ